MDLLTLAHYPFLPEVREAVQAMGVSPAQLLQSPEWETARRRGMEKVRAVLEAKPIPLAPLTNDYEAKAELLSVPIAKLVVSWSKEKTLAKQFADAEATRILWYFATQTDNVYGETKEEIYREIGKALGTQFRISTIQEPERPPRLGMIERQIYEFWLSDYLRLGKPNGGGWALVQRTVNQGWVRVEPSEIPGLFGAMLRDKVKTETLLELERSMEPDFLSKISDLAGPLEELLTEAKKSWSSGDFGPVRPELFPPCVHEIFEALKRNENVPHHGRFAFATFLHTVGWSSDQILDYLASTPNFDREKSRYQIEHVTGGKSVQAYTPPGCATMQTNGVCPLDKRDGLCFKIKHPLSYYRAKVRSNPTPEPKQQAAPVPEVKA